MFSLLPTPYPALFMKRTAPMRLCLLLLLLLALLLVVPTTLYAQALDLIFGNFGQNNRVCLNDGSGSFTCSDVSADTRPPSNQETRHDHEMPKQH